MIKNTGIRISSSIILLKPSDSYPYNYEILLTKRKSNLSFANNYVFPGGVVDLSDHIIFNNIEKDFLKITAVRETYEECGIYLTKQYDFNKQLKKSFKFEDLTLNFKPNFSNLFYFLRFITPHGVPKRYDTQFFIYEVIIMKNFILRNLNNYFFIYLVAKRKFYQFQK